MSSPARQMNSRRLPPLPPVTIPSLSPSNPMPRTRGAGPKAARMGISPSNHPRQPMKVSRTDMLVRGEFRSTGSIGIITILFSQILK